jgi:hypothetical protein
MKRLRYASDGHLDGTLAEIRGVAGTGFDPESSLEIELSGHCGKCIIRVIACSPERDNHLASV